MKNFKITFIDRTEIRVQALHEAAVTDFLIKYGYATWLVSNIEEACSDIVSVLSDEPRIYAVRPSIDTDRIVPLKKFTTYEKL